MPLASRIVFACDSFHAMTSDRPYRKAMVVWAALEELQRNSGKQFNPSTVRALLDIVGDARADT
jgi:HD-GYP domain-containing protein (c-di-GMP phosphodiesterase class II)